MKLIQSRRRGPPDGAILLEDGKKVCENVVCTAGKTVKVSEPVWGFNAAQAVWGMGVGVQKGVLKCA